MAQTGEVGGRRGSIDATHGVCLSRQDRLAPLFTATQVSPSTVAASGPPPLFTTTQASQAPPPNAPPPPAELLVGYLTAAGAMELNPEDKAAPRGWRGDTLVVVSGGLVDDGDDIRHRA